MSVYTIVGSRGFIGSNLSSYLKNKGESVLDIERILPEENLFLGTVFYCAGYGDCKDPCKVVDANFNFFLKVFNNYKFDRIFYISSTRLYLDNSYGHEGADLVFPTKDPRCVFNLSKLLTERTFGNDPRFIALRLSNVYGNAFKSPLFLPSIIRDAVVNGKIRMLANKTYSKDYINIEDVCDAAYKLSKVINLKYNVYNIASSKNTSAGAILEEMARHVEFGVDWFATDVLENYPEISIQRLIDEIDFTPACVLADIKPMIELFNNNLSQFSK